MTTCELQQCLCPYSTLQSVKTTYYCFTSALQLARKMFLVARPNWKRTGKGVLGNIGLVKVTHHKATLNESAPQGSHCSPEDNLIQLQWKVEDHGFHGDPASAEILLSPPSKKAGLSFLSCKY